MSKSGTYVPMSCSFWDWEPSEALGLDSTAGIARLLWLGFYSSPVSKRLVPGLWRGTPAMMADLIRLPTDMTWNAFERLREHGMVEYDHQSRIVRLTKLPDATSRAHNDRAVFGWWNGFVTLPDVVIRNAHVAVLWLLMKAGKISTAMQEAWEKTFGTISIPNTPHSKLSASGPTFRRLQTSLFDEPEIRGLVDHRSTGSGTGSGTGSEGEGESVRGEGEDFPPVTTAHCTADEPFSVDDVVRVMAALLGGTWSVSADQQRALELEILNLSPEPDLGLLRDYLTATRCSVRQAAELLSGTGHLASAFSRARQWAQERDKRQREMDERAAFLAQARSAAGV